MEIENQKLIKFRINTLNNQITGISRTYQRTVNHINKTSIR